ncbi:MAG: type IX secretion system sortase PorU [Muribaculum sp.]|nr:type IX secretion system sortase PorU [Muribaculum sp.]
MRTNIITHIHKYTSYRPLLLFLAIILSAVSSLHVLAFDPRIYAESSVLASGKWARVSVSQTGMQFVSNAQLQNLGFSDPSKVNVYGFGGRMISEQLSADMPDDLPLLPVVRTQRGILFFGVDTMDWERQTSSASAMTWSHIQHAYGLNSYYFISDRAIENVPMADATASVAADAPVLNTFTCRTVHESEIFAPSNSGRNILGEDFRSPTTRNFSFPLPDPADGNATARIQFAGGTTSGWDVTIKGSGNSKASRASQNSPLGSAFMQLLNTEGTFPTDGEKFSLDVTFTGRGGVTIARLDWIEVEWTRSLKLRSGQLHIYDDLTSPRFYRVEGCDESTVVWDVTTPSRPRSVKASLNGSTLTFPANGNAEFIVFNPQNGYYAVSPAGAVANQDVHSLPVPDMLIISPSEYFEAGERIAALHREQGMVVHNLTPEALYNEFSSGTTDVSAFRKALKMWQDRAGDPLRISYCLIISRPTYDNKQVTDLVKNCGYPRIPIWQSPTGFSESSSYSTDDFIGMLDDPKGRFAIESSPIRVAVGRFPVTSLQEAMDAVKKTEDYVRNPIYGAWRNNVMLVAEDGDNGIHLTQAEEVYKALKSKGNGQHLDYERLYLGTYATELGGTGKTHKAAKTRMLNKLEEGVLYWDYIGHANPYFWGYSNFFLWNDMMGLSNDKHPFFYGATCEYTRWDADERSGGEMLWQKSDGGIIASAIATRSVLISSNGPLNRNTGSFVFEPDKDGLPKRMGQFYVEGKNSYLSSNTLRYCFVGDPALRLAVPTERVVLDSIAGVDIASISHPADYPQLKARQKVKIAGRVTDVNGNLLNGFNGQIHIRLLDAEKPVTTIEEDEETRKTYNDRKTMLYTGIANVENGLWSTLMYLPPEIENNYAFGRLTFYANTPDGVEANGSSEQFYVYGYDDTAEEDLTGPDIHTFALNRPDNTDGCVVHTSPMVLASFSDPSGINISDAGIGHKLTLVLDGKKYFEDVNAYYSPDPFDSSAGSISYPMEDITPGAHTLKLVVWDNANNSSSREISFNVNAAITPSIYDLTTDCNPASTSVEFILSTDRPRSKVDCLIEVFDLQGRTVWSKDTETQTDIDSALRMQWNLTDHSGLRVERGIYLYRATITAENGAQTTKTKKLAVTAP